MRTLSFSEYDSAGINITYNRKNQTLRMYGWFDHFVGIEGGTIKLWEFFKNLGIPKKQILEAIARAGVTEGGKE